MATALIPIGSRLKRRLARRAKKTGKFLSQEVRNTVDMHLEVPPEAELRALAREATASADRSIARLDAAIAYSDRELKKIRKSR